ncbi:MAG: S46 family peptidase [Thermoanaerobaculia bacterium]
MRKLAIGILSLGAAVSAMAGEGMWMPQQIPQLAAEMRKAGLKIDPSRFADLTGDPMGAVVSLGGCSASFVSKDGLVVTNHHCGFGALQFNSTPQRDLINNGFLARTREEELPAGPGSRVFVTTKIEDVTAKVSGGLSDQLSGLDREKSIDRNTKQLVEECEKPGGVRCRVASFFEGAQYLRTTQMEIRDVRMVYAPALGVGNFGGEADNWMWPRHTGDWSYMRAYVGKDGKPADYSKDNVPYHPAHILKVASEGMNPGDFVLVAGYPGRTFRYRTAGEVSNMQSYSYPTTIKYATDLNNILREMGKNNRAVEIANANRIKGNDNTLKNYQGTLTGFNKFTIVAQRQKREAALAAYIASHPEASRYSTVMSQMSALQQRNLATQQRDTVMAWVFRSSPMLSQASALYRLSLERPKADIERESGYQQRDFPRITEGVVRAQKSLEAQSDRAGLKYFLNEASKLPADQRIKALDDAVNAASGIDPFLDKLYASTKVGDLDARKAMQNEATAQLLARHDSMIDFAAALSPLQLENERREKEIGGEMSRVRPMYMDALKATNGGRLYPDANGTLRITFGNVAGYVPRDGVMYVPQTTISGITQKNTGSGEFDAPKAELEAIKANRTAGYVDRQLGEVPVNFLSTVDTTGGNSGSPTLNAKGELCGLLFDGTYESLGSDFVVEPSITRSIHVDAVYMLWMMDAVDGAHNLLKEMNVPVRFPNTPALGMSGGR